MSCLTIKTSPVYKGKFLSCLIDISVVNFRKNAHFYEFTSGLRHYIRARTYNIGLRYYLNNPLSRLTAIAPLTKERLRRYPHLSALLR